MTTTESDSAVTLPPDPEHEPEAPRDATPGTATLEQRIGGKGAKLARLGELGCRVPRWFPVEAAEFRAAVAHPDVSAALVRAQELVDREEYEAAAETVRTAVLALPLDPAFHASLVDRWHATFGTDPGPVAVRSSAIGEDGTDHSFAGQFESVLGVQTELQLLDAVRQCWASAWTGRAVAYRARHGMDPLAVEMGLVVQTLVDADVAGVMFTGDPISGDPYTNVVSATYGLGESLVSGIANADTYRVDRRDLDRPFDVEIADKDLEIVRAPDGLTLEREVEEPRRSARALTDAQVRELVALGEQLERGDDGRAQDVEWAFSGGVLHVLQTRPVTTPLRPRGIRRTWDNSNIVESYSGVVSPLTFSFAREAYTAVYFQALKLLRLPASEMDAAQVVVRQMLGYVDGRVYYNLASWYYLLSVMPNYEENAAAMEQMMGVRAPLDRRVAPPASTGRTVRLYAAMGWQLLRIRRSVAAFRANVRDVLTRYDRDFAAMDADQLVDAYDALRTELLANWQTPIVGDTRVMMMFDRLKKTVERLGLDPDGTLHNDLMCGQGEVESAEPTYHLVRVAERIRGDDALSEIVLGTADEHLRGAILGYGSENARWVHEQLEEYLARFGDRCANELKLETPTLRENPAFLFSVLRNFVRQDDLTEARMLAHEREIADAATSTVEARMAASGTPLTRPLRRASFRFALRHARSAVRDREAMRFDRTRVFGLARRIFTALGHRLHEAGLIDDPRDVFLLEVAEIVGTVQGTTTITNLRGLVELRRVDQERWLAGGDLPDRVETVGITNANPREDAYAGTVDVTGDSLAGIGCCAGTVERPVRVVHSPDAGVTLDGDIMVCTRTDPGWVPLFPSCGGLLVERGSLLSHSAIVAREFGIPAVVGIPGLMGWARDGETVRMDGSAGTVERVTSDDDAEVQQ